MALTAFARIARLKPARRSRPMVSSTVQEIEAAIATLSSAELQELYTWLEQTHPHPLMNGSLRTWTTDCSTAQSFAHCTMRNKAILAPCRCLCQSTVQVPPSGDATKRCRRRCNSVRTSSLPCSPLTRTASFFALKKVGERHGREVYSARSTLNYRALAIRQADGFLWFWIGDHRTYDSLIG